MTSTTRGGDGSGVGRCKTELYVVSLLRWVDVELPVEKEVHLVKAGAEHCLEDVPGILHPVDVTDFLAVVRRNWQLGDSQLLQDQLNDDLGIKMEIVRVLLKWDLRQSGSGVEAIPAV